MNRDRMTNRNRRSSPSDGGSGSGQNSPNQGGRERLRGRADNNEKSRGWFMRHKIFTFCFLPILVVLLVVSGIIVHALMNPVDVLTGQRQTSSESQSPADTSSAMPLGTDSPGASSTDLAGTAVPTDAPPDYQFPKDIVNILLLGTDTGLSRGTGIGRTDCCVLVSINQSTHQVSMISIPRDTYVKIYNQKNALSGMRNRVNTAYEFGGGSDKNGYQYAMNTVSRFLCNVPIDHCVVFDMDLVVGLINKMGGVTVNEQLNESFTFDGMQFSSGVHKLNGLEALTYARDRHHTSGGDLGRDNHQRDVMIALLDELKQQNKVSMIPTLYQQFQKNIKTDLDAQMILALAWIAKDVDTSGIANNSFTVPGTSLNINGGSFVIGDQQGKIDIMKKIFGTNAGLDFTIHSDETYNYLYGKIQSQFKAGITIVNEAKSLLANNAAYYTADQAAPLQAAINTWEAAYNKHDTDGMDDAQQDVETQYQILKAIVDANKAAAEPSSSPSIEPSDTPADTSSTEPTESPTDAPTDAPTDTPAAT